MTAERLTVPTLIARWSTEQPDTQFLVADDATLTYGDLDDSTRATAARLARDGVVKGTRVGVLMPNGAAWAVAALALARLGAVIVPLSTLLRPPELEQQLRVAAVERLLVVPTFRGRRYLDDLREISPALVPQTAPLFDATLPRLRAIAAWTEAAAAGEPPAVEVGLVDALAAAVRPADDLAVVFTSGSRGTPRGVIHTHGGALGATAAGLDVRCVTRDDRLYIPMPFFWVGGFGTGLLSVLVAGATLVSEAQPEPARTLELLQRERVTLFRGWPDQADALAAHPGFAGADLRALRPGSLQSVLPAPARGRRAPLLGMTESFGPYCGERLDRALPESKAGSCGRPFADVDVRIVDPDTGATVPAGTVGEIHIRGRNLMRGICGRERREVFTSDGFYPTGDLGVLDADGYLFFRGRRDDMFKVRGASVYPSEVEAALVTIPEIDKAFVVDVADDSTEAGESAVGAVVVLVPGADCSVDQLAAATRARLSAFKVPVRWSLIAPDEVPVTATGKVDQPAIRRLLGDRA